MAHKITKEQLEELYINQRLSFGQVAAILHIGSATVWRKLHKFDIPTRSSVEVRRGRKLSPEHREKVIKTLSSQRDQTGENNPYWKGGRSVTRGRRKDGFYVLILVDGKYVPEHRYVMEQHLGRKLSKWEHVHHRDDNKENNVIDNLVVMSISEHQLYHLGHGRREEVSQRMKEVRASKFWSTKKK